MTRPAPVFVCLLLFCLPLRLAAEPRDYTILPGASEIRFLYRLLGTQTGGTMPLRSAALRIDFDRLENTRIAVTLDAARARTTLPFAEAALKSASVLDTANHPTIRFESTGVRRDGQAALLSGRLSLRGQTAPATLRARFLRPQGTAPGGRDQLVILLEGTVSRAAFGATGFGDLVADPVALRIRATLRPRDGSGS